MADTETTQPSAGTPGEGPPVDPERTDDESSAAPEVSRVAAPARKAIAAIRSGVVAATEPVVDRVVAASEPLIDRVGHAIDGVERTWQERPGARVRRVRRMGASPLSYLNDVHPEARFARPVQVGMRIIDVADIAGTAVGGGTQRGGDFLPLRPFRGKNWKARWQRLRQALDILAILPPIDVVKYRDRYWVVDGHNRVGLAQYAGQDQIDASIVELVPPGGRRTEPITSLAASAAESLAVRTAGSGHRPSDALSRNEPAVRGGPPDDDR